MNDYTKEKNLFNQLIASRELELAALKAARDRLDALSAPQLTELTRLDGLVTSTSRDLTEVKADRDAKIAELAVANARILELENPPLP